MKVKKYQCSFCGLHCECKTTITPNRCLRYDPGFNPVAKWEIVEPKKRRIRKCENCNKCVAYSDGNYCNITQLPANKVCREWEEFVEE